MHNLCNRIFQGKCSKFMRFSRYLKPLLVLYVCNYPTFAVKKNKMKKVFIYIFTAALLFSAYWFLLRKKSAKTPPAVSIVLMKHSPDFNSTINKVITGYLAVKDAFVESDTNVIKSKTRDFITLLNTNDTNELKKDTSSVYETVMAAINDVRSNAESIIVQPNISEMRKDFSSLTDIMFPSFFVEI